MVDLNTTTNERQPWVRGVNLGGWLVMERYIAPYQFAITDCHVRGDFCWFPGALSAPAPNNVDYKECDPSKCRPFKVENDFGNVEYPVDEKTLTKAFMEYATPENKTQARENAEFWFNSHFENFIKRDDLQQLRNNGITHVRVPLPHWIVGDVEPSENWIVGKRWEMFVRVCKWAREIGLEVWPDIHTAPGSQNGFDNSGQAKPNDTCDNWAKEPMHVARSLMAIKNITQAVKMAEIDDVVTGFGLLNEAFADCSKDVYKGFIDQGLLLVRQNLGPDTAVYVSDLFKEPLFNDGQWWLDAKLHNNTYLDSHFYQVFDEGLRELSPRQHIAFACERFKTRTTACCYEDAPNNTIPSHGVSRMVGEWSASFDILPGQMVYEIMKGISIDGYAPHFNRTLTKKRQEFLRHFVEAQIVTYEAADVGVSNAWFYWTAKMEGGAFAEWDYLRGIREGWVPHLALPEESSESIYRSCYDILLDTSDDEDILEIFPDPKDAPNDTHPVYIDDDVVLSHGMSLYSPYGKDENEDHGWLPTDHPKHNLLVLIVCFVIAGLLGFAVYKRSKRSKYTRVSDTEVVV